MRILIGLVAVISTFVAPWWVPALCMLALSLRFPAWEAPFIGLLMDLLWLPQGEHFMFPFFTLFGVIILWIARPLRRQLLL